MCKHRQWTTELRWLQNAKYSNQQGAEHNGRNEHNLERRGTRGVRCVRQAQVIDTAKQVSR